MSVNNEALGRPERFLYGVLAFLLFIGGCIALSINSYILFSGVWQSTHSESARYALGFFAGMVPWFIAVMPLLIQSTWRQWGWLKYPSFGTLCIICAWGGFIAYNLLNGAGAVASERGAVVSSKEHANSTFAADKERRTALLEEAKGIPQARPENAVNAQISGEKLKRTYELSDSCGDPKNKTQRTFCVNLQTLETEREYAARRGQIQTAVAALDAKLAATSDTVGGATDPTGDMVHAFSCSFGCWDKASIALWLPASTPIALEATSATSWYFAGIAFAIAFGRRQPPKNSAPEAQGEAAKPILVNREQMARIESFTTLRELEDTRRIADTFFAQWTVRSPGASLSEREWFESYEHFCRLQGAKTVPEDTFRRVAMKYIPDVFPTAGGYLYRGALPVMPKELRKGGDEAALAAE